MIDVGLSQREGESGNFFFNFIILSINGLEIDTLKARQLADARDIATRSTSTHTRTLVDRQGPWRHLGEVQIFNTARSL